MALQIFGVRIPQFSWNPAGSWNRITIVGVWGFESRTHTQV